MGDTGNSAIRVDLAQFKLSIAIPGSLELTLLFDSPSRRFYLAVIGLVVREMHRLGRIASIPLQDHLALLAHLNDTVGEAAGSSDAEHLLPRIYRKWKMALPDLEGAPLFKVLGRKRDYQGGSSRTYHLTDLEKDRWANLFAYTGSEEHIRLRFSIDTLGARLEDIALVYEDARNELAWERFVAGLKGMPEQPLRHETAQGLRDAEPAGSPLGQTKRPWVRRYRWVALGAVLGLGVAGAVTWTGFRSPEIPRSRHIASLEKGSGLLPEIASIAVLPFAGLSDDPKETNLARGLTQEIASALTNVPRILVIGGSSALTDKGKVVDVRQVGRGLGVRYVLEGTVQQAGTRLRITARLIDTTTGRFVFSERYERDLQEVFALQEDIAIRVLTALGVSMGRHPDKPLRVRGTQNLEAYLRVVQAREYQHRLRKESQAEARRLAEEAIALDPSYASAYAVAAAAIAYEVLLGAYREPREALEHGMHLARQAVALDDSLAAGHFVLGRFHILLHRDYDQGLVEAERAVALEPTSADTHAHLATFLTWAGRSEEALAVSKHALSLAPFPSRRLSHTMALIYRQLGQYDEAIAILRGTLQRWPDDLVCHLFLTFTLVGAGQVEAARAEAAEVRRIDPRFSVGRFARVLPWKDQAKIDGLVASLRQAGLH